VLFIVKLKHYISKRKLKTRNCAYKNRSKVVVVHMSSEVFKVLYCQEYLRQSASQIQKLTIA